jgi:MoaA/NifB/PqqE/SkfB family radical SAM enzyme
VGLLTPCNLACGFCYRDRLAPSRLTAPFLVDLLEKACDWGVLEVAFGGGEPLLFKGFVEMLRELGQKTSLGLGFTTNGTLLTDEIIDQVRGIVSEIRVSAYSDNGYRATLRRLRGVQAGVNWLVTPENVGLVEPFVVDCIEQGAKNVLLLGYKGDDRSLHLGESALATLRRALHRLEGAPIRLDVCWYPHLGDVPQLFERSDCRAGDEFLVITPDRAVQACSFAKTRHPFETFDDLRRIYEELRARKPEAEILGCTRSEFRAVPEPRPDHESAWVWQAAASNNSGDWTIAARFCDAATATRIAESLRELSRAHEAFLASPEGQHWIEEHDFDGSNPTPPLVRFGEAHGFEWTGSGNGLWWEEDGCGAPVLTAGAIGDAVVVYHPYCMGLPEEPFRAFFQRMGAIVFGHWQYQRPKVVVRARGRNDIAERRIHDYLELIRAAEYAYQVKEAPPWGETCKDPRVLSDEDGDARLDSGDGGLERTSDWIQVTLSFENTFAGSLAVAGWLSENGYADVEVSLGPDPDLYPLANPGMAGPAAQTGLFGDLRPLEQRLHEATLETVVALLFRNGRLSEIFKDALGRFPPDRVAELALAEARAYWARDLEVTEVCVRTLEHLPQSPAGHAWARALWAHLREKRPEWCPFAVRALQALSPDEAFEAVAAWCNEPSDANERAQRLVATFTLRNARLIDLYEEWWNAQKNPPPVTDTWTRAVAMSGLSWSTARRWIERGRPLSLLAVEALSTYSVFGVPEEFGTPDLGEVERVLRARVKKDPTPRMKKAVESILSPESLLVRGERL